MEKEIQAIAKGGMLSNLLCLTCGRRKNFENTLLRDPVRVAANSLFNRKGQG